MLGLLDGIGFFMNFVGLVEQTLTPSNTPVRSYLIHCIITALSLSLVPLCPLFEGWAYPVLVAVFLISGFSRYSMIIPYMAVIQYFESAGKDKGIIGLWINCLGLGDVIALVGLSFLIKLFSWKISFYICIFTFVILALAMYLLIDEIPMAASNPDKISTMKSSLLEVKNFVSKLPNALWIFDYAILSSLYYLSMMWYPYYFLSAEQETAAIYVSIMPCLCYPIGSWIFGTLTERFRLDHKVIVPLNLFLSAVLQIYLCFIEIT